MLKSSELLFCQMVITNRCLYNSRTIFLTNTSFTKRRDKQARIIIKKFDLHFPIFCLKTQNIIKKFGQFGWHDRTGYPVMKTGTYRFGDLFKYLHGYLHGYPCRRLHVSGCSSGSMPINGHINSVQIMV
jgi:hypothetical protein